MKLRGFPKKDLEDYHPLILDALLNHLPDAFKQASLRRLMAEEADWDETRETGDPEWDEMERAIRAGMSPHDLPSWGGDNGG